MKSIAFVLLGACLSLSAAQPPSTRTTKMAPPPGPPVTVLPAPAPPVEVTPVEVARTVLVTNAVIVTNAVVVTNTVLVTNPVPQPRFVYEQRLYGGRAPLVTAEQARAIIDIFRTNYAKLGSPRFLLYVNRELVDETSGMRLAGRTERTEHTRGQVTARVETDAAGNRVTNATTAAVGLPGNVTASADLKVSTTNGPGESGITYEGQKASNENSYRFQDRKTPPLADRQTTRDVERLFGRPFRLAGASLADQTVAAQMLAGRNIKDFTTPIEGEQARKDREALGKIADVVIEILISSKNVTVQRVADSPTYSIPDIQATAIRLNDSKVMAQSSSSDLLKANPMPYAYDVSEVAEGTALVLMQDMLLSVP